MFYHFFINEGYRDASIKDISLLSSQLDSYGYKSFLQVYDNSVSDAFLKGARALNESDDIKFMIALRPRAISPEYCAMMVSAFNSIMPNRLMLNIIHGALAPQEIDFGVLDLNNDFSSKAGTLAYTREFLSRLRRQGSFEKSPTELVVSGANPETVSMARDYGDYLVLDYERFKDKKRNFNIGKKLMIAFDPVILETEEQCIEFKESFRQINLVVKTKDGMLEFIKELELSGVTDVLFSQSLDYSGYHLEKVHEFVKKYSKEFDPDN